MSGTTVPAALPALAALFASALPGWTVIDGPVYDIPADSDFMCVGFSGNPDEAGVDVVSASADLAMESNEETYVIRCVLTAHAGTNVLPTLRATAYAGFTAAVEALSLDADLGGVVDTAEVVSHSLVQGVGETGVAATVLFTVQVHAWA